MEPILRECVAILQKKRPAAWGTFHAQSLLGDALLGQEKYTEAFPLLEGALELHEKVRSASLISTSFTSSAAI